MSAQQMFAVIKARSKYNYQQPREHGPLLPKAGQAVPFPVEFGGGDPRGYIVRGNGNQYRIEDCNFFVRIDPASALLSSWPFVRLS